MISPTVGRVVWYWPGPHDTAGRVDDQQPLKADVVYVWSDTLVNLMVVDHHGHAHARERIKLVQDGGNPTLEGESYCEWMPYQKGQAAKTERLESALAKTDAGALKMPAQITGQLADTAPQSEPAPAPPAETTVG